jgi:putative ribosome biogenesis GTPase RsgA
MTLEIQVLSRGGHKHYFVDISGIVDHDCLHRASECQHIIEEHCLILAYYNIIYKWVKG